MKAFLFGLVFGLFALLIGILCVMAWDAAAAQTHPAMAVESLPPQIILEEPGPVYTLRLPLASWPREPEIAIKRPPSSNWRDRIPLYGMDRVFDVGAEWTNQCKIGTSSGGLLKCKGQW